MKTTSFASLLRQAVAGVLLLGSTTRDAPADVVTDWNTAIVMCFETEAVEQCSPGAQARLLAIAHFAMLDAILVTVRDGRRETSFDTSGAAVSTVAATAANDVLQVLAPEHASAWHRQFHASCPLPDTDGAGRRAMRVGAEAAERALHNLGPQHRGSPTDMRTASMGQPLMLRRVDRFRAKPPYAISITGAVTPTFRDRSEFAGLLAPARVTDRDSLVQFWTQNPECAWNRLARHLAAQEGLDVLATARLFTALNTALSDACLAAAESERFFRDPRRLVQPLQSRSSGPPVSAYGAWEEERTWNQTVEVEILVPPVPDYPSQTGAMAGAAAAVLEYQLGRKVRSFVVSAAEDSRDGAAATGSRSFASIGSAARECAMARVLVGREFAEAGIAGYDLGLAVGRWIARRGCFRPNRAAERGAQLTLPVFRRIAPNQVKPVRR